MADEQLPQGPSNRGPWIIAGAIVLAALIAVGGYVLFRPDPPPDPCAGWQRDIKSATDAWLESAEGADEDTTEAEAAIWDNHRLAVIRVDDKRPVGCDYPDEDSETWAGAARVLD